MNTYRWLLSAATVVSLLGLSAQAYTAEPTKPIKLRMATFLPTASPAAKPAIWLSEQINERTKGKLIIEIIGGPEAIPGDDQPSAVRSGVVDMILSPPDESLIPESMCLILSPQTPAQERASGFYDYMAQLYRKQNILYLGRASLHNAFVIMLTEKRVTKPEDLAGLKLRASATTLPLIKALGAAPVSVPLPDVYTAMDRGVVDGTIGVKVGLLVWGLAPVVKYTVNHSLYGQNALILVNLDSWIKLPQEYQAVLKEVMVSIETNEINDLYIQLDKKSYQAGLDEGMQLIDFSPADGKRLIDLAHEVMWAETIKKAPENGPKLRKLLAK